MNKLVTAILVLTALSAIGAGGHDGASYSTDAPIAPATVTDITVESRNILSPAAVTVALPEGYSADSPEGWPVVYLLNGHGGNNRSWSTITRLDSLATEYDMIFVCPDGRNSWYWDSPVVKEMQMESYIIDELIPYIDSHYRTRADRTGRAITGLSMGGHGALWLALRHLPLFGAAGSTSGGVDIMPYPTKWNIPDRLGPYASNPRRWREHSVKSLTDTLQPGRIELIFDCGTSDFFYKINCRLDSTLKAHGVEHVYLTSPGGHTPQYWRRSIEPQLEFFHKYFSKQSDNP